LYGVCTHGLTSCAVSNHPFREEVNRIVRHYITIGAPRQIALSKADRTACLHAIEHTTHPSALLPAFTTAEAVLRGESHPNFIRWSISNANRPLVIFLRVVGALFILLGFGIVAILALSSWSRFWRLVAVPLWILGFTTFIAALDGVCLSLHAQNKRQLRPWDQAVFDDGDVEASSVSFRKHVRTDTATSAFSSVDPLRKPSLQSFGPRNDFADEPWVGQYRRRWLVRRVDDVAAFSQNSALRVLQSGVVATAILWAVVLSVVLAVSSYFVPSMPILW
jgi:hypothetical protein